MRLGAFSAFKAGHKILDAQPNVVNVNAQLLQLSYSWRLFSIRLSAPTVFKNQLIIVLQPTRLPVCFGQPQSRECPQPISRLPLHLG